jgi:superfamily II DNA helicase RecQ
VSGYFDERDVQEIMSRKRKVNVQLNEARNIDKPSQEDIEHILRAADEIIDRAGRSMLVKILKGSKDKKVLEHNLEKCPSYGYYKYMKMADIEVIVDWMIWNKYLRIIYNGRLPMIVFTEFGWELYKPVFANEKLNKIMQVSDTGIEELVEEFRTINREVINIMLRKIQDNMMTKTIRFLKVWINIAYKKDAKNIRYTLNLLEGSHEL